MPNKLGHFYSCSRAKPVRRHYLLEGKLDMIAVGGATLHREDLTKNYGSVVAVERANMVVQSGEFITFLGPSGSGKTTTLSMVAGFTTPSEGDIRLNGNSTVTTPVHKRNIGMVFQNYALFPHLTVAENIAFPLKMRGVAKGQIADKVEAVMAQVRLKGFGDRKPKQLSGGQQQRVALARAMVFEPNLILLDEPLGALDANLREEMKIELKQLHQRIGATILFVTHDQEEALTLSDRIAVFNEGKIVQMGAPDALYDSPTDPFVADFIGEANQLDGQVVNQNGDQMLINVNGTEIIGQLRDGFEKPETTASYTLRYERIAIGESAASRENAFEAEVEEFLYSGGTTKILFRLNPETRIAARVPQHLLSRKVVAGDRVKIGWNASDMLLVASI